MLVNGVLYCTEAWIAPVPEFGVVWTNYWTVPIDYDGDPGITAVDERLERGEMADDCADDDRTTSRS